MLTQYFVVDCMNDGRGRRLIMVVNSWQVVTWIRIRFTTKFTLGYVDLGDFDLRPFFMHVNFEIVDIWLNELPSREE